jgi:ATP-binding protein involved in chromosome partitioning
MVENMSYAVCPHCGEKYEIFGPSHAEQVAALMHLPLLGRIPLDPRIATLSDEGRLEEYTLPEFDETLDRVLERVPEKKTTPAFM